MFTTCLLVQFFKLFTQFIALYYILLSCDADYIVYAYIKDETGMTLGIRIHQSMITVHYEGQVPTEAADIDQALSNISVPNMKHGTYVSAFPAASTPSIARSFGALILAGQIQAQLYLKGSEAISKAGYGDVFVRAVKDTVRHRQTV